MNNLAFYTFLLLINASFLAHGKPAPSYMDGVKIIKTTTPVYEELEGAYHIVQFFELFNEGALPVTRKGAMQQCVGQYLRSQNHLRYIATGAFIDSVKITHIRDNSFPHKVLENKGRFVFGYTGPDGTKLTLEFLTCSVSDRVWEALKKARPYGGGGPG